MMRRTAAPFHRLDAAVRSQPWMITLGEGEPAPLQEMTPDWDYATPVTLERLVSVDHELAAVELGYGPDEPFQLDVVVETGSGPGDLPRDIISRTRLPLEGEAPCRIILSPDPTQLSAQITLRTSVILAADTRPDDPLAPRAAGARLWDERLSSRIEGDDPRFPMEVISFSTAFAGRPHESAPWLLSWSPRSPGQAFHGATRLYVNADDSQLVARLREGDGLTLQALMADVISQMCEAALAARWDEEFDCAEPETVAGRVAHWLERAFPDVPAARALLENRPGEFRAAILSSVRL
ncbi:hypothetical protein [Brevundimonas diminuta]|uniref:Uncharacterized protein n=1 Tax=Brevundimonas diminuta TaxID=293 RepID=A0A1Z3LTM9_BREDI|nr:hypothetical protein [Brevundimonas diminuta]ASD25485.1 hypothetical protein CD943_00360 [Brevundimonas diminuta]